MKEIIIKKTLRPRLKTKFTKTGKAIRMSAKLCYCAPITEDRNVGQPAVTFIVKNSNINNEVKSIFNGGRISLLNFAITPSHELGLMR